MASNQQIEKGKRLKFLGTEAAGVAAAVFVSGWIGVPVIAVGLYFGYDWFMFRAKNGMRF